MFKASLSESSAGVYIVLKEQEEKGKKAKVAGFHLMCAIIYTLYTETLYWRLGNSMVGLAGKTCGTR